MEIADYDELPEDAPWLQQPDETNPAYAAFCIYRDLGVRRSLRETAQKYYELPTKPERTSGSMTAISKWSRANDWVERAWAFTAHKDRMTQIAQIEEAKEMGRRHAAIANVAVARAAERLNNVKADKLSVREAALLLDLGVKVERLSRGQATDIVEATDDVAERSFKAAMAENPTLALAARDIAVAMTGVPTETVPSITGDPETGDVPTEDPETE